MLGMQQSSVTLLAVTEEGQGMQEQLDIPLNCLGGEGG